MRMKIAEDKVNLCSLHTCCRH